MLANLFFNSDPSTIFFQSLSVPYLSCLRRHVEKSSWAKVAQSVATIGWIRLLMENPYLLSVIWRQKVSLAVLKPLVLGNCFGGGGGEVGDKFMKLLSYVSGRV